MPGFADESLGALDIAVQRARTAHAANTGRALAGIAAGVGTTDWVLVERLLTVGDAPVARAVAEANRGHDAAALRRYAADHAQAATPSSAWIALQEVIRCRKGKHPGRCLLLLRGVRAPDESVLGVLFAVEEAQVHAARNAWSKASAAWTRAADRAEMIGWRTKASTALGRPARRRTTASTS